MNPLDDVPQAPPLANPSAPLSARLLEEWRQLVMLGAPILVAQLAQMANGVVDTVMAGHASAEDLAAVGIGSSVWMPLILMCMGTLSALQPLIARHRGAREWSQILPVTWQGLYIAAAFTLLLAAVLPNMAPVLQLVQLEPHTRAITQGYLSAFTWGVPALLLVSALRGLTDGLGHTRVFMAFSVLATLINIPLNYVFIYGKLGLPAMGGVGCGWATSLSQWISALALLGYLHTHRHFHDFRLLRQPMAPSAEVMRRVLKLGMPIGITTFVEVSMFAVIALFLAPLGPVVVAGHQIVLNFVSMLFMVPLSLGMALTLRISFLLGAQQPQTARLVARGTLVLALGIALINMPLLILGRDVIAALYTQDSAVQAVAAHLLLLAAVFQLADVSQVTAINALRGYHDTRLPMMIVLLAFWVIALPLGYVLTFSDLTGQPLGAAGFWVALIVGLTCAALLLAWRLFRLTRA